MYSDTAIQTAIKHIEGAQASEDTMKALRAIQAFGTDDYPVGTVLIFDKTYSNNAGSYHLAVVKQDPAVIFQAQKTPWVMAGERDRFDWLRLLQFLLEGNAVTPADVQVVDPHAENGSIAAHVAAWQQV